MCWAETAPVGAGMAGAAPGWAGRGGMGCVVVAVVVGGGLAFWLWPCSAVLGVTPSALAALMGL